MKILFPDKQKIRYVVSGHTGFSDIAAKRNIKFDLNGPFNKAVIRIVRSDPYFSTEADRRS